MTWRRTSSTERSPAAHIPFTLLPHPSGCTLRRGGRAGDKRRATTVRTKRGARMTRRPLAGRAAAAVAVVALATLSTPSPARAAASQAGLATDTVLVDALAG